jgi:hypothetical protein
VIPATVSLHEAAEHSALDLLPAARRPPPKRQPALRSLLERDSVPARLASEPVP